MRKLQLVLLTAAMMLPSAVGQTPSLDSILEAQLEVVFPEATSFSTKQAGPPHFVAYDGAPRPENIVGYVFWTTELEPLERGYDGPIKMLVGVNRRGILTGVLVTEHREPYGYFSVDLPEFPRQFVGKDIRDPFSVGGDVDAVSRATITVRSSARAIRNGARRIARALLVPRGASR